VMLGIRKPPECLEPSGQVLVSCLESLLLRATCGVVRLVIMHDGPVAYIGAIIGTAALTWNAVVWVIERRTKASVCGGYSRAGIVIRVVNRCSHQIQVVSVGATDEVDDASYFADVSGNMKLYGIRLDDPLEVVEGPGDIGPWREESLLLRSPQLMTHGDGIWNEWLRSLEEVRSASPDSSLQGSASETRAGHQRRGTARGTVWIQVAAGKKFSGPLWTSGV
jgi:hypothetical protein